MKILSTILTLMVITSFSYAQKISEDQCNEKGNGYLSAGGECINYKAYEGDGNERLILVIHGSWKAGTNILGRYAPFAETLNMNTDITTVAIALPGYSGSSSNAMPALEHEAKPSPSATKEYVEFLGQMVEAFKTKFEADNVTYVGHSAGARMGATLMGVKPGLINQIALAGGGYVTGDDIKQYPNAISFMDVMDSADKEAKYLLIYGSADEISKPEKTINAYEKMKEAGFDVQLVEAKGAKHLDLDMTDASVNAITTMLEE